MNLKKAYILSTSLAVALLAAPAAEAMHKQNGASGTITSDAPRFSVRHLPANATSTITRGEPLSSMTSRHSAMDVPPPPMSPPSFSRENALEDALGTPAFSLMSSRLPLMPYTFAPSESGVSRADAPSPTAALEAQWAASLSVQRMIDEDLPGHLSARDIAMMDAHEHIHTAIALLSKAKDATEPTSRLTVRQAAVFLLKQAKENVGSRDLERAQDFENQANAQPNAVQPSYPFAPMDEEERANLRHRAAKIREEVESMKAALPRALKSFEAAFKKTGGKIQTPEFGAAMVALQDLDWDVAAYAQLVEIAKHHIWPTDPNLSDSQKRTEYDESSTYHAAFSNVLERLVETFECQFGHGATEFAAKCAKPFIEKISQKSSIAVGAPAQPQPVMAAPAQQLQPRQLQEVAPPVAAQIERFQEELQAPAASRQLHVADEEEDAEQRLHLDDDEFAVEENPRLVRIFQDIINQFNPTDGKYRRFVREFTSFIALKSTPKDRLDIQATIVEDFIKQQEDGEIEIVLALNKKLKDELKKSKGQEVEAVQAVRGWIDFFAQHGTDKPNFQTMSESEVAALDAATGKLDVFTGISVLKMDAPLFDGNYAQAYASWLDGPFAQLSEEDQETVRAQMFESYNRVMAREEGGQNSLAATSSSMAASSHNPFGTAE